MSHLYYSQRVRGRRTHNNRSNFERDVQLTRSGAFNAGIFLVHDLRDPPRVYVEKCIKRDDLNNGFAEREVHALRQCNHPNITKYIDYDIETYSRTQGLVGRLILQYCELGDLDSLINECRRTGYVLPEHFLWSVFWDMSLALCHLRTGRDATPDATAGYITNQRSGWCVVLHRDVKPQNILLTWRGQGPYPSAVLADFGCSVIEGHVPRHQGIHGASRFTLDFCPPEMRWDYRGDIFSLGLTMHCLARRIRAPIRGPARGDPTGERYSSDLSYSVSECLNRDPANRISATNLPVVIFRRMDRFIARYPRQPQLPAGLFPRPME